MKALTQSTCIERDCFSLRRFLREEKGVSAVEFAALMPLVVMLTLGSVDLARYVMINQKMDRAAATLADLTARVKTVSEAEVGLIFDAVEKVAEPFDLNADGVAIISSVVGQGTFATIDWQRTGAGTGTQSSSIGSEGQTATLPPGLELEAGEGLIVAEIIYQFEPDFVPKYVLPRELYFQTFFRPRRSMTVAIE